MRVEVNHITSAGDPDIKNVFYNGNSCNLGVTFPVVKNALSDYDGSFVSPKVSTTNNIPYFTKPFDYTYPNKYIYPNIIPHEGPVNTANITHYAFNLPLEQVVNADGSISIFFDVPGVEPEDISVTVDKENVLVTAQRKNRIAVGADKNNKILFLNKIFLVPKGFDVKSLEAEIVLGVLTLSMKSVPADEPKKIAVKVGR